MFFQISQSNVGRYRIFSPYFLHECPTRQRNYDIGNRCKMDRCFEIHGTHSDVNSYTIAWQFETRKPTKKNVWIKWSSESIVSSGSMMDKLSKHDWFSNHCIRITCVAFLDYMAIKLLHIKNKILTYIDKQLSDDNLVLWRYCIHYHLLIIIWFVVHFTFISVVSE